MVFLLLFGFLVPLLVVLFFVQLLYVLAVMVGPIVLVLFGAWVVYRLVRRLR